MAKPGDRVRAKRLGWDGSMDVDEFELYDPYDYPDDVVEGEYDQLVLDENELVPVYTNHIVAGQVVDPDTIEVIDERSTAESPATLLASEVTQ